MENNIREKILSHSAEFVFTTLSITDNENRRIYASFSLRETENILDEILNS